MRVGWGVDAHRFSTPGSVRLGGVVVDESIGVEATSDGDVVAHAVIDAILGAAAMGDIGDRYPSGDPRWKGADSMSMLTETMADLSARDFRVTAVDVTVIAERVRLAPHRERIRANLSTALGIEVGRVSVKATTTDGLGFTGRGEGLAAMAVVVVEES